MANRLQLRRGTGAPGGVFHEGEPVYDKSGKVLYVGDDGASGSGNGSAVASASAYSSVVEILNQASSTSAAFIKLLEDTDNGNHNVSLKAPAAIASNYSLVLPDGTGSANQVLKTDGSGNLDWVDQNVGYTGFSITDGSNTESIASGNTITFTGGTGITAAVSSTDTLTISLTNNSITVSDGSNSTARALGDTLTIQGTANEVTVTESSGTVTVALPDDVTIGSDLTVTDKATAERFAGYDLLEAPYSGTTKTITVTVASKVSGEHRYHGTGSGSGYVLDGVQSPFLTLTPGRTYRFDTSDSSNSGHPFLFYMEADKTTQYTTNVTTNGTPGSAGAYTQIVVGDETPPVLHYQCSAHGYMGNAVSTLSNVVNSNYNATLRGTLTLGSSTAVSSVLDEDNMATNSATALATQQSIKAYVDSQVSAVDVTTNLGADSGSGSVSTSQTLTVQGTTNEIVTSVSNQTITVALPDDVTIGNDLTVNGNLNVVGTAVTFSAETTRIEDRILELGLVNGSAPSSATTWDLGVAFNYNSSGAKKAGVVWLNNGFMAMLSELAESSDTGNADPQITATAFAPIAAGGLYLGGVASGNHIINSSGEAQNLVFDGGSY